MKATKLPSGKWRINAYAGKDATGKDIRKSFTGTDKKKLRMEAAAWVDEHRHVKDGSCTFGQAAESFMELRASVLSPATMRGYSNIKKKLRDAYPAFWNEKIFDICSNDLQELIDGMIKAGASPKTIKNHIGFISTVLRSRQLRMPVVHTPQRTRPDLQIPDIFTVKRTLEAAKPNRELWICIMLAATGPLRRGEIAALRMEDIDFDRNVIHVCRDMVMGPESKWHTKPPKTPSSDRFLVMPPELIEAIREQGYVTTWTPKQIYNKFHWLLEKNEIKQYRFHDLRHFCVSHLKSLGIEDLYIAQRTGHADYATLRNVYTHTMQDHQKKVDEKILAEMKQYTA